MFKFRATICRKKELVEGKVKIRARDMDNLSLILYDILGEDFKPDDFKLEETMEDEDGEKTFYGSLTWSLPKYYDIIFEFPTKDVSLKDIREELEDEDMSARDIAFAIAKYEGHFPSGNEIEVGYLCGGKYYAHGIIDHPNIILLADITLNEQQSHTEVIYLKELKS